MEYNDYLKELSKYREQINAIDEQLVQLLVQRVDVVVEVGHLKRQANQAVLDKSREAKVIEKVIGLANKESYNDQIATIYQCIMDQAKTLE